MLCDVVIPTFWVLFVPCIILGALSAAEVSIISYIVSYIHLQGSKVYHILSQHYSFPLNAIPAHLNLSTGHLSNAAAGLGFLLSLFGMWIALKERPYLSHERIFGTPFIGFLAYILLAFIEFFLVMAALIYDFVYTSKTSGFTVSLARASQEVGQHYAENEWVPGTWFEAVLALPLESASTRNDIQNRLQLIKVSQWMLVPIFVTAVAVMVAALFGLVQNRRMRCT